MVAVIGVAMIAQAWSGLLRLSVGLAQLPPELALDGRRPCFRLRMFLTYSVVLGVAYSALAAPMPREALPLDIGQ